MPRLSLSRETTRDDAQTEKKHNTIQYNIYSAIPPTLYFLLASNLFQLRRESTGFPTLSLAVSPPTAAPAGCDDVSTGAVTSDITVASATASPPPLLVTDGSSTPPAFPELVGAAADADAAADDAAAGALSPSWAPSSVGDEEEGGSAGAAVVVVGGEDVDGACNGALCCCSMAARTRFLDCWYSYTGPRAMRATLGMNEAGAAVVVVGGEDVDGACNDAPCCCSMAARTRFLDFWYSYTGPRATRATLGMKGYVIQGSIHYIHYVLNHSIYT